MHQDSSGIPLPQNTLPEKISLKFLLTSWGERSLLNRPLVPSIGLGISACLMLAGPGLAVEATNQPTSIQTNLGGGRNLAPDYSWSNTPGTIIILPPSPRLSEGSLLNLKVAHPLDSNVGSSLVLAAPELAKRTNPSSVIQVRKQEIPDQSPTLVPQRTTGLIAPLPLSPEPIADRSSHPDLDLVHLYNPVQGPCFLRSHDSTCSTPDLRLSAQFLTEAHFTPLESSLALRSSTRSVNATPFEVSQTTPVNPPATPQPPAQSNGSSTVGDPELGILRLQELEVQPPKPPQPSLYLLGRVDYLRSSNIFSGIDPVDDNLVRGGLTLWAAPALGPQTYLVASASANVIRYFNQSQFSYNEFLFSGGIYQQLSPQMYGQLSWVNQRLYTAESGQQFLDDHSVRLEFGRTDPIADRLNLDTFYQFRASFADPSSRSRVINYFSLGLSYDLDANWQTGLEYQLSLTDFTQQSRNDTYQQVLGRLSYRLTPESRINILGGYSFGASSNSTINFNGSIFGVTLSFNLPLF